MATPPPTPATEPSPPPPSTRGDRPADETLDATVDAASGLPRHPHDAEGRPFGRYRLLDELGRGGMGVVWRAWDTRLRRVVALKQIGGAGAASPAAVARFQREARLAAQLRHPHIVAVYDVEEEAGQPYFTTEYIAGTPLDRRLAAAERPPRETLVRWLKEVAEALQHAHDHGVIHRDVKPANILIDGAGRALVTDFGLATEVAPDTEAGEGWSRLTASGIAIGTPSYMSPEQATGERERIGPAADQFSLGVTLYESLTGALPFVAGNLRGILNAVVESDPKPPRALDPSVPRDLETVCLKALEKKPSRRYASMADLAADLGRVLAGEPIRARPLGTGERLRRALGRNRGWLIAAAAAAVLLAWPIRLALERARDLEARRVGLERSERAARVMARFAALTPTLRSLEASCFDSGRTAEERRASGDQAWPRVAEFMAETPADAVSQATMRAFAGWARRLAGHEEEGRDWLAQARAARPDLPYGALLEGLTALAGWLERSPLPPTVVGPRGLEFGPPPEEPAHLRALRERAEALLAEAASAEDRGEGMAADFRRALDALRAYVAGRVAEGEAGLTRVLGSGALEMVATDLRLARARARYQLRRFAEGEADLDAALEARPGQAELHYLRGAVRAARAEEPERAGASDRDGLARALADFDEARARAPADERVHHDRAVVLRRLGDAEGGAGGRYEAAIAGFDAALALNAGRPEAWNNRALAWLGLAGARVRERGDAADAIARAFADCDESLRLRPGSEFARHTRGLAGQTLGDLEIARGNDPRPVYRRALEDLAAAVDAAGGSASSRLGRVTLLLRLADAQAARGEDPAESYAQALADLDAAAASEPGWASVFAIRAKLHQARGQADFRKGVDAGPAFARALADAEEAVRLAPDSIDARTTRGVAAVSAAEAQWQRGGDGADLCARAIADFDEVLRRQPGHSGALVNRGNAHASQGRQTARERGDPRPALERALADYAAALAGDPRLWQARGNRGLLLEQLGRPAEAAAEYEEALRLVPGQPALEKALQRARAAAGK